MQNFENLGARVEGYPFLVETPKRYILSQKHAFWFPETRVLVYRSLR